MKKDEGLSGRVKIYDVVTVGERGQVVIPAKARKELNLKTGAKLVVIKPIVGEGVVMFKIEEVAKFMGSIMNQFGKFKDKMK
jgi:AbrB family looped-hinge helix DNA binding protein